MFIMTVTVQSNLILEKLDDPLIWKGSYTLEVKFSMKELFRGRVALESTINSYTHICQLITKNIQATECNRMLHDLKFVISKTKETEEFIKEFFPTRRPRGFLTWIGAMDSDDRTRVDTNLDTLRQNEESLKDSIKHQTNTVDAMYKFIDSSMIQVDTKMKQLSDNINALQYSAQENRDLSKSVKTMLYWETELIEAGMQIQTLLERVKYNQNIILQLLLNKEQSTSWFVQLIEPATLFKLLEETENNLPGDVTFPRKKSNGNLLVDIINSMDVSYETQNNFVINFKLKVPLVTKTKYTAYKGIVLPQMNETVVASIALENNILIQEEDQNWGFVVSESQFNKCKSYSPLRICDFKTGEINLNSEEDCLLNLRFRNSSKNCKIRILKVTKETWFATEEPNIWEYVTPYEIKINVFHGFNHTFMTIKGSGRLGLTPGTIIVTNNTKLSYSNETISESISITQTHIWNDLNITIEEGESQLIPTLKNNLTWHSIYDHKKLFDLGVDVEDIKKSVPTLGNMIYSPLSYPWTFYSMISVVGIIISAVIIIMMCKFKNHITCKEKSKPQPKFTRNDIIHHVQIEKKDETALHEIFCNPNLIPQKTILLDRSKVSLPLPAIPENEEDYLEAISDEVNYSSNDTDSVEKKVKETKISNNRNTLQRSFSVSEKTKQIWERNSPNRKTVSLFSPSY